MHLNILEQYIIVCTKDHDGKIRNENVKQKMYIRATLEARLEKKKLMWYEYLKRIAPRMRLE